MIDLKSDNCTLCILKELHGSYACMRLYKQLKSHTSHLQQYPIPISNLGHYRHIPDIYLSYT
jgi:hypothetical protein